MLKPFTDDCKEGDVYIQTAEREIQCTVHCEWKDQSSLNGASGRVNAYCRVKRTWGLWKCVEGTLKWEWKLIAPIYEEGMAEKCNCEKLVDDDRWRTKLIDCPSHAAP